MLNKHSICGTHFVAAIFLFGSALAVAQSPSPESLNPETQAPRAAPAPVRLLGQTLFEVKEPIGALTPAQRAAAIEQRLREVADQPATSRPQLQVIERNGVSEIDAGPVLIRTVTDRDAQGTGRTRRQLAADQLLAIRQSLAAEDHDRSITYVLRGLLYATLATGLMIACLIALRSLSRWTRARITQAAQAWHWQSGLARLRLFSPSAVANVSRYAATLIALLIGLLLVYFYLDFVLSLFTWSRFIAEKMADGAKHAVVHVFSGLFDYVPSLFNIILIVIVARYSLIAFKRVFEQIAAERLKISGFYSDWAQPTYSLVRFFVIVVAAIMVFPYLPGSGSEGFRGISIFLGLLVSLGAASSVSNVIAGVIITYMRPFQIGDRVQIADSIGDVIHKNLLVVRLRTIKNVDVTIPNAVALANHVVNFSSNAPRPGLILHTTVTIGYDVPWKKVHELLIAAARRVEGILAEPAPFVLQTKLDDSYAAYEINAYTDRPNEMANLYSRLHEQIQNVFYEGGVEILSPNYAAVRDGNRMAVPDDYLPKGYQAPAFGILSRILRPGQRT
jgi:small-conductance mechanosensitive channel